MRGTLDSLQFNVIKFEPARRSARVEGLPQQAARAVRARRASQPAPSVARVKILTWNVNGMRARQARAASSCWRPSSRTSSACRRSRRRPIRCPSCSLAPEGYWCYWHGGGGYSGVALLVRSQCSRGIARRSAIRLSISSIASSSPTSARSQVASVYVPNGGKDYDAKLRFLEALADWAAETSPGRSGASHLWRPERGARRAGRASEGAQAESDRHAAGGAGAARPAVRQRPGRMSVATLDPDNDELFTWWAPWRNLRQRNIGWRIDYVLASQALAARATVVSLDARVRHERSRAGRRHLRRSAGHESSPPSDRRVLPAVGRAARRRHVLLVHEQRATRCATRRRAKPICWPAS